MNEFLRFLGTIGGVSAIVLGLSTWIGHVWATRIAEAEKARHAEELERLRLQLDLAKAQVQRISEAKFKLYNDVWTNLQDVRSIGDRLWERASKDTLQEFIDALRKAQTATNCGRLLLRENDYQELKTLLTEFENYRVGKQRLIEIRSPQELDANFEQTHGEDVEQQIKANSIRRTAYEQTLDSVVAHFREELGIAT
jgi:hypothetical protein